PPGTGKTWTACRSARDDRDVFVIGLTPETPAVELRGFWMSRGSEFIWQDGVFVEAMRSGARIVINEIAHASHDVLAILHPILESRDTAQLTLPNLETIRPVEGFQVVCTDNPPPTQSPEDLRNAALRTFDLESARSVSLRGWLSVFDFLDREQLANVAPLGERWMRDGRRGRGLDRSGSGR
ncbi:MAG: AAA family ATPase, partial [bacterium]|nr:AAA family ATPase [bacterium]